MIDEPSTGVRELDPSRERLMDRPSSRWKYGAGFLTVFHAGKRYELGYFKLHEDARNAALAFGQARRLDDEPAEARYSVPGKPRVSSQEIPMSDQVEGQTTFAVSGGIFGVGRLATRLNALVAGHQIAEWHIGHWVDWRHTAIRVNFASAADAALAKADLH